MNTTDPPQGETLYRRLGGYDAIAAVIAELMSSFGSDPKLARFSVGRSLDSRQRSRQLLVDQICALAGGPCVYIGRDMKTSHIGLAITEAEWQLNMKYTADALDKCGVGPREKAEFLAILEKYKNDIVEQP